MAPAILEAACTRYKALGIWSDTPVLPRAGYDRLRDGLVSGGFVSPGAPFETAVDNTLAAAVAAEQLPPLDRRARPPWLSGARPARCRADR